MGLFDSIILEIKCPHCGEVSEIDVQTKELNRDLDIYRKGDFVTDKFDYLICTAFCEMPKCVEHGIKIYGEYSWAGRLFDVKIFLEKGIVTGEYEIV